MNYIITWSWHTLQCSYWPGLQALTSTLSHSLCSFHITSCNSRAHSTQIIPHPPKRMLPCTPWLSFSSDSHWGTNIYIQRDSLNLPSILPLTSTCPCSMSWRAIPFNVCRLIPHHTPHASRMTLPPSSPCTNQSSSSFSSIRHHAHIICLPISSVCTSPWWHSKQESACYTVVPLWNQW